MQSFLNFFKSPRSISYVFTLGMLLFAIGISWSPALLSIAVMILSILILFQYDESKSRIGWNRSFLQNLDKLFQEPYLICYLLFLELACCRTLV